MKRYIWNIFVSLSILLGSLIFGTYKTTLSANLGRIENENVLARSFCKVLDVVLSDPDHCQKEYEYYLKNGNK